MPKALLEWILTEPSTGISEPFDERALNVMQILLQASSGYVSLALDRAGILSVETPEDAIDVDMETAAPADVATDGTHTTRATASSDGGHISAWDSEGLTGTSRTSLGGSGVFTRSAQATTGHIVPLQSALEPPSPQVDSEYRRLLGHVISTAREAVFPSRGPLDMAGLSHALGAYSSDNGDPFRLRTMEKIERDKRIGAAGELFVSLFAML